MSVPVQTPVASFAANGITTVFPYAYLLLSSGDLQVTLDGVVLTSGFTISGVGSVTGGNVTFAVAPASGTLILRRKMSLSRLVDYVEAGDLLASTLNLDLDRIWMVMQGLQSDATRSIKLPEETLTDQTITDDAATRASKLLGFDVLGNVTTLDVFDPTALIVTTYIETLLAAADAAAARTVLSVASISDMQTQSKTAFTTSGTAPNFTVTTSPTYPALLAGQRMRVSFHATGTSGSSTLNRDGTGAKNLKQYDRSGTKVSALAFSGQLADVEYDGTDYVILNPVDHMNQVFPVSATVNANALTISLLPCTLQFRSTSLTSGVVTTVTNQSTLSVVIGNGVTLGTINGQSARLVVIAFWNGGTLRLGVTNLAGGINLDETGLLTFSEAVTSTATALYSDSGTYSSVAYRVVGFVDITEATAGVWATDPTLVQGAGGNAVTAMSSLGYGQTLQAVTRAIGTTYYNTTGRPIALSITATATAASGSVSVAINGGGAKPFAAGNNTGGLATISGNTVIPPGASYVLSASNVTTITAYEMR